MIMPAEELSEKADGRPFGRKTILRLILCIFLSLTGFFVVPLLVIEILSSMPGKVFEVGPRELSAWHLRDIGLAMHDYADKHRGAFPPAVVYDQHDKPLYSWRVLLLPYLDEQALYSQFKLDEPWDSPHNMPLLSKMPHVYMSPWFICRPGNAPQPKEPYATPYQVFTGGGAMFEANPQTPPLSFQQILSADGMSKTLMVVEAAEPVPWTKPQDLTYSPDRPLPEIGGLFPNGFHGTMADGGTRWFSMDIDEKTIRAMITWNGGEPVDLPD
jgi:hypothetical protein